MTAARSVRSLALQWNFFRAAVPLLRSLDHGVNGVVGIFLPIAIQHISYQDICRN